MRYLNYQIHFNLQKTTFKRMGSKNGKPALKDEDIRAMMKTSSLTEQEVKATFQTFLEEHPDGKFDKKEFSAMMQKAMPQKDASKMEKHIFRSGPPADDFYNMI